MGLSQYNTPGTFVVPLQKMQEMYSREVLGRNGSNWMEVKKCKSCGFLDNIPGTGHP